MTAESEEQRTLDCVTPLAALSVQVRTAGSYEDVVWIFNKKKNIHKFCVIIGNYNYKLIFSCIQYVLALSVQLLPRL